jgi:hypothetical protein
VTQGAAGAVERIAWGVSRAARLARRLAVAAAAAAATIAYYVLHDGFAPVDAVVIVVAAVPPVGLWLFAEALGALAGLPSRLRSSPGEARARLGELAQLGQEARASRTPFLLWRLARVAGSSRELLTPHAAVLPLASVPFLLFSAASVAAAALEIVVALVLLVVLAL